MGFLDHSTNNIIIDAVLTDTGRSKLAKNDGSFSIVKFAFGDDEVDYTIIQKFGRTVGKEKIEKNTPVFEGQTTGNQAQKYKCVSLSNPSLTIMPTLSLTSTTDAVRLTSATGAGRKELTFEQETQSGTTIDSELVDQSFIVGLDNRFLQLPASRGTPTVDSNNQATYVVLRTSLNASNGAVLTITVSKKNITSTQYSVYSTTATTTAGSREIITVLTVTGLQSGVQKQIPVTITEATS